MLDAAWKEGLEAVCITDHIDEDYPEDMRPEEILFCLTWIDIFRYPREIQRKNMPDRLDIRIGD